MKNGPRIISLTPPYVAIPVAHLSFFVCAFAWSFPCFCGVVLKLYKYLRFWGLGARIGNKDSLSFTEIRCLHVQLRAGCPSLSHSMKNLELECNIMLMPFS